MNVLPDVLNPGLDIVFCGTAAGTQSARAGAYYAGRGNKFWATLFQVGLTPRRLDPHEFRTLPAYGIGLTDLAKSTYGADAILSRSDFDAEGLRAKIGKYTPMILAFTSKRAAKEFYGCHSVDYGRQPQRIGSTAVFVLPSPSGLAQRYWDIAYWQGLANAIR